MISQNIEFEREFQKLNEFYKLKKTENIHEFIEKHEKLLVLLDKTRPYLKEVFPHGEFELEVYYDLSGEGNDQLLLNIHVDDDTFKWIHGKNY